ncbi:MAG: DNA polymerase I, partial [Defluviitaleaceae bacterium]|nr:DNA polymerase I [Defluviitaleaceae bacterium]
EFKSFFSKFLKTTAAHVKNEYRLIVTRGEAETFFSSANDGDPAAVYVVSDDSMFVVTIKYAGMPAACFNSPESAKALFEWLESGAKKIFFDSKKDSSALLKRGAAVNGIAFDVMLAGYVLDALKQNESLRDAALNYLNEDLHDLSDLQENGGKRGKDKKLAADLPPDTLYGHAAGMAGALSRLYPLMKEKLDENGQSKLYYDIELPLAGVLFEMENAGLKIDTAKLAEYGEALQAHITDLTESIYETAGTVFNINSPTQLGEVLFEKIGLKGTKKTTKGWSTAADVLDKLKHKHPVVPLILEYRSYAKLKSTYADGLLPLVDPETSRIHSTFNQALTATGRISSSEPNLQNIPVKLPLGRELRKSFVAPDADTVFMDADYSQIELRVLASVSGDETLIGAFRDGCDIHRMTASQVFGVSPDEVTQEQRTGAKAVNFGIVYGISPYGLSEDLKIPISEAERYINGYFDKYPKVKAYLDKSVNDAKSKGYAETIFGRRRKIPELNSQNFAERSFGERVAMNMPIQGTAADIIKIAMIRVSGRLKENGLKSRIVLQVHDELLLEVNKAEREEVRRILGFEMENAADLAAALVAEVHEGDTWFGVK